MDAANLKTKKGMIGILTGGGDVPGLNPAIRAVTIRALREGCQVIGIRRGWAGLVALSAKKTTTIARTSRRYRKTESTARAAPAEPFCTPRAPTPAR